MQVAWNLDSLEIIERRKGKKSVVGGKGRTTETAATNDVTYAEADIPNPI